VFEHGEKRTGMMLYEKSNRNTISKHALVLVGKVSRMFPSMDANNRTLAANSDFGHTPLHITGASILKHFVEVNGGPKEWDLFIHSWSPELETALTEAFTQTGVRLVFKQFEDNSAYEELYRPTLSLEFPEKTYYENWRRISVSTSLAKSAMAVLQEVDLRRDGLMYERVVFTRPDILLIEDIDFTSPVYQPRPDLVHVDGFRSCEGDYYFIMSSIEAVQQMSRLTLDTMRSDWSLDNGLINAHKFIKMSFVKHCFSFQHDWVHPEIGVAVYRALCWHPLMWKRKKSFFEDYYQMSLKEWDRMFAMCKATPQAEAEWRASSCPTLQRHARQGDKEAGDAMLELQCSEQDLEGMDRLEYVYDSEYGLDYHLQFSNCEAPAQT